MRSSARANTTEVCADFAAELVEMDGEEDHVHTRRLHQAVARVRKNGPRAEEKSVDRLNFSCLTPAIRIGKFQAMGFASPKWGNRLTIFRANDSC